MISARPAAPHLETIIAAATAPLLLEISALQAALEEARAAR